jgi:hypothetical protein
VSLLADQLNRASVLIAANLAEGNGRFDLRLKEACCRSVTIAGEQ